MVAAPAADPGALLPIRWYTMERGVQPIDPILLIEDDPNQREPLTLLLELKGYVVRAVSSVAEAWAVLEEGSRPCLIILDLMLPVVDGTAFRRAQLLDPVIAPIPVILYSASTDLDAIARQLDVAGAVAKPGNVTELIRLVDERCLRRTLA